MVCLLTTPNISLADLQTRLIGINALSLILALIANIALLFNMARRIPFFIAQPITIIGWYISSFLLIGLIVAASYAPSMQLPPESNPALTGAFYYAILAAGLYIVVASLMSVTVYGAYRRHYSETFELTMSQRTLMLQTIAYLVYLLGGAAVYAHIENWLFLNAVWWANYTLLTIGIGDFHVTTNLGKGQAPCPMFRLLPSGRYTPKSALGVVECVFKNLEII